jgi:AAA domain
MPETSQARQQHQRRRVLIPWEDAAMATASNYLVKGILPRTGLAVVWGPPKCGKSFWTFDLVVHIALGREYRGRPVRQGVVVYCALEGGGGFGNRIEAWRRQHLANGEQNVPFYLIPQPFDLVANYPKLIDAIRDELGKAAPAVIVIDTLNRALVGDENKSEDMAKFIKALGAVQAAFDCLLLVVHHCGVAGSRPRGHTSLAGADDVQIRLERDKDGTIRATIEHAKDFEAGAVLASKLERVKLDADSDGDAITSCVIVASEASAAEPKLPKVQQLAYDALKRAIKDEGVEVKADSEMAKKGAPVGQRACLSESWRQRFYDLHDAKNQATKRQALFRATLDLEEAKLIKLAGTYAWMPDRPA